MSNHPIDKLEQKIDALDARLDGIELGLVRLMASFEPHAKQHEQLQAQCDNTKAELNRWVSMSKGVAWVGGLLGAAATTAKGLGFF